MSIKKRKRHQNDCDLSSLIERKVHKKKAEMEIQVEKLIEE